MGGHRIALVPAARQHHRRPEIAHRRKVRSPVGGDGAIENRSELRIGADLSVEPIYEAPDPILGYPIDLHGRLRHIASASTIEAAWPSNPHVKTCISRTSYTKLAIKQY